MEHPSPPSVAAIGSATGLSIAGFVRSDITVAAIIEFAGSSGGSAIITGFDLAVVGAPITALFVAIIAFFAAFFVAVAADWGTCGTGDSADETGFDGTGSGTSVTGGFVAIIAFLVTIGIEDAIAVACSDIFALLADRCRAARIIGVGMTSGACGAWGCDACDTLISGFDMTVFATVAVLIAILAGLDGVCVTFDGINFFARAVDRVAREPLTRCTIVVATGISSGDGGVAFFPAFCIGEFAITAEARNPTILSAARAIGIDVDIPLAAKVTFFAEIIIPNGIAAEMCMLTGIRVTEGQTVSTQAVFAIFFGEFNLTGIALFTYVLNAIAA